MKKRISPKVSSLFVLAGVMTTASVVSLATSTRMNNTTQLSTSEATTSSSTSTLAASEAKMASVSISNGYKSKITNENVARTTSSVKLETTTLKDLLYRDIGFKYPGINSNYSMDNYRYGYPKDGPDSGKKIDYQQKVMAEEIILANRKWVKYSDAQFANQQIGYGTYLKHPAADNMYAKSISSSAKAITKKFDVNTNKKGTISLGLFAAPGEPVTIKFDKETFDSIKKTNYQGLQFIIGDNNFDEYGSNYNTKLTTLYPYTRTVFDVNPNTQEFKVYSPFGGAISLKVNAALFDQEVDYTKDDSWIKFEASGALECLEYVDGQTTKEDWDKQIQKLKDGKITAPVFTGVNAFGSVTIPFTYTNAIGGVNINDLVYPKAVFDKWKDFGFLSSYVAGQDETNNPTTRLAYNFSTDSNWGGGIITRKDKDGIYASPEVGGKAFLMGSDGFSTEYSNDLIKTVSSMFARSGALFKDSKDEDAYKTIYAVLAMILDTGRERNNNNQNDLNSLSFKNSYENVKQILSRTGDQKLALYLGLIYTVGPKNFIEYVRYSATNNPNTSSSWTPLKEIEKMSDFFKLDLYYTFTNSGLNWNAGWPSSYNTASSASDRNIINKLKKYKAVDIVGNMYATGLYNPANEKEYTGDSSTVFQVMAGEDYTFDLNKFINSANRNFKWSQVSVSNYSKCGAKLEYNSKTKTIKYNSGNFYTSAIDEFDITIKPAKFAGMPSNYVSGYKWKVKVQHVTNSPLVSMYNKFKKSSTSSTYYLNSMLNNEATPYEENLPSFQNKNIYYNSGKKEGVRYRFKFVAPEDGRYQFSNIWDDSILMKVNGKQVYTSQKWTSLYTNTTVANLNKGDSLDFDIVTMNMGGDGAFGMRVQNLKNPKVNYNLWDYVLIPNIETVRKMNSATAKKSLSEYIDNQKYVYKPKSFDYFLFNDSSVLALNSTEYLYSVIDTKNYDLSSPQSEYNSEVNKLKDQNSNLEVWNQSHAKNQAKLVLNVKFKTPVSLSSVVFTHRTDNHANQRPTIMNIEAKIGSSNQRLYYGNYGAQFNDRSSDRSGINLDKTYNNISELTFTFINTSGTGIIFRKMYLSSSMYAPNSSWTYHNEIKNSK